MLAAAAVLTVIYFAVLSPIIKKMNTPEDSSEALLDGEVLDASGSIMMFEKIERANLKRIEVYNSYGAWAMYRADDDNFYIENHESVPYNENVFSSLIVSAGDTISLRRVTADCQDFSEYGLDDSNNPAHYKIISLDGIEHTVYIGDQIPTSGGYYARYEGRGAVYILTKGIANTLLAPVTAIAHSMVSYPMSTTTYFQTRDFYIMRDGKMLAWIDLDEAASSSSSSSASSSGSEQASNIKYKMKAPAGFVPNSTTYSEILTKFSDFSGEGVVEIGAELSDLSLSEDEETKELLERIKEYGNIADVDVSSEEYQYLCVEQITTLMHAMFGKDTLDKYGLYEPKTVLHYTYNGVESFVLFGDEQEDGYRYAYSALWNTIVAFDPDDLDFLDWGLLQYVDKSLFSIDITTVKQLTFKSDEISETFDFGVDSTAQTITVTPQSTGKVFSANELYNFRSFYRSLLTVSLEGYADSTAEENQVLSFEIRTYDGTVYDFDFYRYSTRRCYYTINGEGQFYVLSDSIDKVISDCKKLMNSQDVDSWAKN